MINKINKIKKIKEQFPVCHKYTIFGLKELTKSVVELMRKLPIPRQFLMKSDRSLFFKHFLPLFLRHQSFLVLSPPLLPFPAPTGCSCSAFLASSSSFPLLVNIGVTQGVVFRLLYLPLLSNDHIQSQSFKCPLYAEDA